VAELTKDQMCILVLQAENKALHEELDRLTAEVAALRGDHVALANVSGALCDAGGIVPAKAWRYGDAVRAIVAERDAARAALAAALAEK
jgi:hypothetical protein